MKENKVCGGFTEYDLIQKIKNYGWNIIVDWKNQNLNKEDKKVIFDAVDDSYDRIIIKNIDLKSFLTSLERDEKLKQLGL